MESFGVRTGRRLPIGFVCRVAHVNLARLHDVLGVLVDGDLREFGVNVGVIVRELSTKDTPECILISLINENGLQAFGTVGFVVELRLQCILYLPMPEERRKSWTKL